MVNKAEIKEFTKKMGLRIDIVEKDYVLGWLLAGISAHSFLLYLEHSPLNYLQKYLKTAKNGERCIKKTKN